MATASVGSTTSRDARVFWAVIMGSPFSSPNRRETGSLAFGRVRVVFEEARLGTFECRSILGVRRARAGPSWGSPCLGEAVPTPSRS